MLGFFEQPLTHLSRCDKAALAAGKWRGIDAKEHGQRGFIYLDGWQRLGIVRVSDCGANRNVFDPSQGDNIPRAGFMY